MFPCLKSRSRTLFIDDDEAYIEVLAAVMPSRLSARFFSHPGEVDADLGRQAQLLREEQVLLMAMDPAREGAAIAQGLTYLQWPDRRDIAAVLVSDHAMPAETGVALCRRHHYHGFRRVLLTGAADADLAVGAFNSGDIEHFIPKQTQKLMAKVTSAIDEQQSVSMQVRGACLETFMPIESRSLLTHDGVAERLSALLKEHDVVEYVTVGSPLGVLGLKSDGSCLWFQIESVASLPHLQAIVSDAGWDLPGVELIVNDRLVPNLDLVAQMSGVHPSLCPGLELAPEIVVGIFTVGLERAT